jgi:chromosome segregation ATPase
MSKLLKEKSALEKKLKESQGKVLVQNTKVKNALKEEKDARKAKEKFVQAAQDRKAVENDLSNVCSKIDELASEEGSVKEKKAKTPKGRKYMSKNDKRRLLSQRESLGKQLDIIKKKIENFSLDGEDAELADFPEMKEAGNIGNTVERLRELLAREAELKQELNRLTSKELSESSGSGMISDSGSSDEGAGGMLDNRGELGKRDDKDRHMKDVGETSDSGALDESFDNKGMLKEMFRDVGNQVKSLSSAKDEHETEATPPTTQTEDNSNTTVDYGKASLLEKGAQSQKNTSVLPQTNYSKDTMLSSEKDGKMVADRSAPYSEVMELLLKEKAKKEAKLSGLEKEIEHEESGGDKTNDADLVSQRKREDLKNKMKLALNELQQRKEALDESKNVLRNSTKGSSEDPEQVLVDSRIALTQQKDKLEADLVAVKDELDKQTQSGESLDDISADYQVYKDIKSKEKDLVAALDKANDKLHKRKDWSAMDNPGEENKRNLAETYADILKRMTEENLNMADLIHELEETKETLSKERGITSELLDLIKSRVGNELLEALMGEGLQSPSIEIREMGMFGGEEYPELFDEVENDTVTVAAIIDDYKKVNQFLFKENQKLHKKIELLKVKVDEDLFASIVDQETVDIEISKKQEISKILENNKTLFEQIVSNTESQNEELQSLRMELEGVRKADKENKESYLSKMKEKVEDISIELDEAKKRREELVQKLKDLENDLNCSNETFEIAGEEHGHSTAIVDSSPNESNESQNQANSTEKMDKSIGNKQELKELGATKEDVDGSSDKLNEIQNLAGLTKEGDESKQKDQDNTLQEVRSSLKEAEELGNRVDIELERLSKELVETETPEAGIRKGNAVKQSDGLGSELNKEYGNEDFGSGDGRGYNEDDRRYRKDNAGYSKDDQESDEDDKQDNEGLNEKMSRVENLQKAFVAKLDEVQKLQEKLKRNLEDSVRDEIEIQNESLKRKLANLEIENEELVSKLQKIEAMNEELRNNLELSKETCDENTELKAKTQSLEKEMGETIAKLNETHKERDDVIEEFENLQKEKKNIEEYLSSAGNENSELKEKMADLQNDKEKLTTNLNESNKARDEIAVELKNLQEEVEALKETSSLLEKANDEMKEKLHDLQNQNEEIRAKLNEANEINKEIAKDVEDLEKENKSLEDLLDAQRKENHELEEKVQCGKDELLVKLNEADRIRQEVVEDLGNYEENNKSLEEKMGTLENENKELNEVIRALKNENEEGIVKLNEIKETIKDNEEKLKSLNDLAQENESLKERLGYLENENKKLKDEIQENESIKETLASLENENNEIIPKMERLEKLNKELEDEIEYLRKEEKDFESLNEKLKANEFDRENIKEELGDLRSDMEEIEDFVRENLGQDTGNGVISALEKCKENCEKNGKQNNLLKAEVEKMKKIQNVVGDNLSEKLLELSKEGMILNDTQEIPKCVEGLVKDKNTLASVLNEYENDLDKVKQHLGESLFSLVVGKDAGLNGEENDQPLKMAEELRCGRHIEDVVREYEDLINSQASDTETVEHLQEKVNVLGQELEALRKQRDGVLVEDDRRKTSAGEDLRNQNESNVENGGLDGRENSGESVKLSEAAPVAGNVSLIFLVFYSIR